MKFHLELDCDHPAFGSNSIHCIDEICRRLREAADRVEGAGAGMFDFYRNNKNTLPSKQNYWTVISYWLDGRWYLRDGATVAELPLGKSREEAVEWLWNRFCLPPAKAWDRWTRVWRPEQQLAIWRREQKANPDGPWLWKIE